MTTINALIANRGLDVGDLIEVLEGSHVSLIDADIAEEPSYKYFYVHNRGTLALFMGPAAAGGDAPTKTNVVINVKLEEYPGSVMACVSIFDIRKVR